MLNGTVNWHYVQQVARVYLYQIVITGKGGKSQQDEGTKQSVMWLGIGRGYRWGGGASNRLIRLLRFDDQEY